MYLIVPAANMLNVVFSLCDKAVQMIHNIDLFLRLKHCTNCRFQLQITNNNEYKRTTKTNKKNNVYQSR
jgi:hypothetical protein